MMFRQLFKTILLTATLFTTTVVMAGNNEGRKTNSIHGKVVDGSSYEGIAGAVVEVEGTNIKVYTDFEGNFTLPELPEGNYNLKSSIVSYNEVKLRNIKVSAEMPTTLEMKLHSN